MKQIKSHKNLELNWIQFYKSSTAAFLLPILLLFNTPLIAANEGKISKPNLMKDAAKGNPEAQLALGACYHEGKDIDKDPAKAFGWFKKSADQGNVVAQYIVGVCYQSGDGVQLNDVEAVKWFTKAAQNGNADAQKSLGLCYDKGKGVNRDPEESFHWFKKAANQGNTDAQYDLGLCYLQGDGVTRNENEAAQWFAKAASQGDTDAKAQLAKISSRQTVSATASPTASGAEAAISNVGTGIKNFYIRNQEKIDTAAIASAFAIATKWVEKEIQNASEKASESAEQIQSAAGE